MLALIAALARNRTIGLNGQLPWYLPEDMKHFRETTGDKTVLMGRRTWESLPAKFRPLPRRRNIVVSRNPAFLAPGACVAGSIADALCLAGDDPEVFVIGGEEVYRQTLPLAQRLYLTEIAADYPGDAFFPAFDAAAWREVSRAHTAAQQAGEPAVATRPAFAFVIYERR